MMKLFTMSCAALTAAGTAGEELAFEQLTFGQKMTEGAITLVLGMGTVFAVLVFLWLNKCRDPITVSVRVEPMLVI